MITGADHYGYLTTGYQHRFYRVEPEGFARGGGEQGGEVARGTPSARAVARTIAVNDGIEIEYEMPVAARVRATLHNAVGRRIGMLNVGEQNAGTHRLGWSRDPEGRRLSAGTYFVLLDLGAEQARLKAVVR
jgi:hypothetical protein